jgi:hypothetical protein
MGEYMLYPASQNSRWVRSVALIFCALIAFNGMAPAALAAPTLDRLMADFGFHKDDVQRVHDGEMVKTTTKETSDREIATVMVFLVKAPVKTILSAFEAGMFFHYDPQVQASVEINGDGALEDFKSLVLEPGGDKEAQRYLDAAPGSTLNLSTSEIAAFRALRASGTTGQPQVEQQLRQMLLARYRAYRSQGLEGIAPYARGEDEQTQPAEALRSATQFAKALNKYAPSFYAVLLKYPQEQPPGLSERFFWLRYAMDGRPNFTLRHRLAMPIDETYVVADREYYVGFDYNETQAIAGFLPIAEGTAVVYEDRTTTDQLGGFAASGKQAIGRSILAKEIGDILQKVRVELKDR